MSPARTNNARRIRGFSLVEAVVAMGVMAILLLGMGGALSMSVSALDQGKDRNSGALSAAASADIVLADLNESTSIVASTPESFTLQVPDRNGDTIEETIAYRWSGASGAPLYRSVNGDERVLLARVRDFDLDLFGRAGAVSTAGSEQVLASFDSSAGTTVRSFSVTDRQWPAQYLKPAFDSTVTSWRISRLRLRLARTASGVGTVRVAIVRSVNFLPVGEQLAAIDITESSLSSSSSWFDIALAAGPLAPDEGVFIRVSPANPSVAAGILEWGSGGTLPYNTFFATSTDGGASWTSPTDANDMRFYAYGTVTTR